MILPTRIKKVFAENPTAIGFIFYIIGLIWFCLLSQEELNNETYLSENALLVGQVAEVFQNSALAQQYENELQPVFAKNDLSVLHDYLKAEFTKIGLEFYDQNFTFSHDILYPLEHITGTNVYAIMRSPSAGRTEALLITVSLRTDCSSTSPPCLSASLSLLLSLMELFRRQIYWAKDIIIVFPDSDYIGLTAWLEAYHGSESSEYLSWSELQGRSGAIQAGLNLEFPHLVADSVDILSEGKNGLLANLDLVNTVVRLAHKNFIQPVVNGQIYADVRDSIQEALGLLHAVWTQSSGSPTGLHGLLIGYQIPAVSIRGPLQAHVSVSSVKNSAHLGRFVEGILRSLNNLQERLHQSFWYYLLPNPMRYISIGVYMPPVLILIGSLLLKLVGFWCTLYPEVHPDDCKHETEQSLGVDITATSLVSSSDPDQLVRKRVRSPERNPSTDSPSIPGLTKPHPTEHPVDEIPPVLSRIAVWLVLSFASGLCIQTSPSLIFAIYKHPKWQSIQYSLGIQPWTSEFLATGVLLLFIVLTVLVPVLLVLIHRCFIPPTQSKLVWSSSTLLVIWTLFLASTACLNVSASFLLSVLVVPLLLLFVRDSRNHKLFSSLFGFCWLFISPPALLALSCLAQMYYFEFRAQAPPVDLASLRQELWDNMARVLTRVLLEANLFGCWTWHVFTGVFTSLWMLTWSSLWCF